MSETQVTTEKATLMALAVGAISSGITFISQAQYITGLILVAVGVLLIVLREYLKFNRWMHTKTFWRGKPVISKSGDPPALSNTKEMV